MASSVIDAFLVTLGLDSKQFTKGARDATKAQDDLEKASRKRDKAEDTRQREENRRAKESAENYRRVRRELVSLLAVFTAGVGLKNFFANTVDGAAALGFLATNLKTSTQELTSWQRASERAGGSAQGITQQLMESADTLSQLRSGLGPNEGLQWFFRLGGSSKDLKDGNSYLLARSKIIHDAFKVDPSQAALYARQLGITEDQFDFIKQGPEAILKLVEAQRKNAVVTEKDAAAALKLKNQWLDFTQTLEATTIKVLIALLPAFDRIIKGATDLAEDLGENRDEIARIGQTIADFLTKTDWSAKIEDAKEFAAAIASIAKSVKELSDRWDEWTGKPKVQTPGVTKLPGAVRIGKTEDLNIDNLATGKKLPKSDGRPKNETLAAISDAIEEGIARTLASFGVKSAGEYIRDKTGKDDYQVGPRKAPTKAAAPPTPPAQAATLFKSLEKRYGLPSGILDATWLAESSRGKNMRSPAGALGHFGFMDDTAIEFGLTDPNDLEASADAAARKLAGLIKRYGGDVQKATAAYNWGEGNLDRKGLDKAPKETRDYISKIARQMGAVSSPAAPTTAPATSSRTEVNIDSMTITTQARDAEGVARSIQPALERYGFTNNANSGMTP